MLGSGGYYHHRDGQNRAQLVELQQKVSEADGRIKKADLATEALRAELEQGKTAAQGKAMELEQALAELAKMKDLSVSEKKGLEKKLADQQLAMEKLKATTVPSSEEQKLEEELKKKLADKITDCP